MPSTYVTSIFLSTITSITMSASLITHHILRLFDLLKVGPQQGIHTRCTVHPSYVSAPIQVLLPRILTTLHPQMPVRAYICTYQIESRQVPISLRVAY